MSDLPTAHPMTLAEMLDRAAEHFGDREAIVFKNERIDYATLKVRVDRFARGLLQRGLTRGDHVVLWMPNRIEWNIALFALARIGAVVVTCNTRYKAMELEYLLRHSDAKALIMLDRFEPARVDYLGLLAELKPSDGADASPSGLSQLQHLIVLGEHLPSGASRFADVENAGGSETAANATFAANTPALDDAAVMIYSSGTTGNPKGCLLSHRSIYIRAVQRTRMFPWQHDERFLVTMPYFHIAGILGPILGNVLMGSTQVVMDVFDAGEAMRLIERERVTITSGVPTMFINIMAHPDYKKYDLRSLRMATLGSAQIPVELMRRIVDREHGMGINALVMYGLTEAGGSTHCSHPGDPIERLVTTAGVVLQGLEDRIVDPKTGRECAVGEEGEIWVRGPGLMLGYYKMADTTAEKLRDGWLRTGDLGAKDEQGYLRVTGRLSDTIIVGGFNTYPAEIENFLLRHPKVLECAVIGVPDPVMGEAVMAFVIPKAGMQLQPEEVPAFLRGRIANFKVPKFVEIVDEFPMTASGKVQKFKLREQVVAQQAAEKQSA